MKQYPIVREVSHALIAPIILFALYVQFHSDFGPGGGFQAGVIFAAGLILYALVHGLEHLEDAVSPRAVRWLTACGLLLYGGTGLACMYMGGNFLDYNHLAHDHHHGQHWGIFAVELGVGFTVAGVMLTIFYSFAGREKPQENEEELA